MSKVIPKPVAAVLSLVAGLLAVLNQTTFAAGGHWSSYITIALAFVAALGIPAITGDAFQAALARIFPGHWLVLVRSVVASGAAALSLALTTNHWSTTGHAIAVGVIVVLTGLGFGHTAGAAAPTGPKAVQ